MAKTLKEIKDYINTKFDAAKNSFAAAKLKNKQNDKIYALAQVNTLNDILEFMKGDKNGK